MSVNPSVFDLNDDQEKLRLSINFHDEGANIELGKFLAFNIKHDLPRIDLRDLNKYFFSFCLTGHSGESQISNVQMSGTHQRLGYVYPMTFFRGGGKIENDWEKRYALIAFHKLIDASNIANFSVNTALDSFRDKSIYPDELFKDDLSIVVIGLENLTAIDIDTNHLALMLLQQKVILLDQPPHHIDKFLPNLFLQSIRLSKVSQVIGEDSDILFQLLRQSDLETSDIGRFLKLYQIFEYSIEKIYIWAMRALPEMNLSSWQMKKKLSVITTDRHRLGLLAAHCLRQNINQTVFNDLSILCLQILDDLDEDSEKNGAWCQYLYNLRNIIVHDQIKMIRRPNELLPSLNESLREVCFELITGMIEPDLKTIWSRPEACASTDDVLSHSMLPVVT